MIANILRYQRIIQMESNGSINSGCFLKSAFCSCRACISALQDYLESEKPKTPSLTDGHPYSLYS
jgi:hypothetical protein